MPKRETIKILSAVLLFFSLVTTEQVWNLRQVSLASPAVGFKVTRNTLDHLQREGLSKALTSMLSPMLGIIYPNRKKFLNALPIMLAPKDLEILFRYAATEQIKIHADEFSSNLNENAAVFRGNVKGVIPRENIELTTAKLRLISGESSNFEKLIGEGGVQVKQWDREMRSDFAIYTQVDLEKHTPDTDSFATKKTRPPQKTLQLQGNVIMKATQGKVSSNTALLDLLHQHATLEGRNTSKEGRIRVEANLTKLEKTDRPKDATSEEPANGEQTKILLFASRAVLDNKKHQAMFEGKVEMERTPDNLYIRAGKISLLLGELQELLFIRAEQGVCFEQPGRVAKADQASFDEITQSILLESNAEVQSGKYHLQGSTINLYLDVNKGVAQGEDKAPIQMTILGEESPAIFTCR